MLVPLSWLREVLPALPADLDPHDLAARLTRAGLAVEGVRTTGGDVSGPVVVGRVLAFEAEPQKNGKVVRWCQVDVGEAEPRGIVCGASNFAVGDLVVVSLPGAVLPGGFAISARKTYGHTSDGMVCSARELGLGDEADGILVLGGADDAAPAPGTDARAVLDLAASTVLDVAVTPDRGYALSLRGVARETATAYGLPFADPADVPLPPRGPGHPVRVEDPAACDRYVARLLEGLDPAATTPRRLQQRLVEAGMRPVSAPVDVTNLVMLGLGQPLHAFDADRVRGEVVVRRARTGERLTTLDGVDRALDPDDLVICDDRGPIALAGVMGGEETEIGPGTTRVLLESAHFDAAVVTRAARRHGLPSEASRRFERGVDPDLAPRAAEVAVRLLAELTGARAVPGATDVDHRAPRPVLRLPLGAPGRKAGRDYDPAVVRQRLVDVGCAVRDAIGDVLEVEPPSWRPDLTGEAELVEEVVRLEGYETVPVALPRPPGGRGLTREAAARRAVGRALADAGLVECVVPPFLGRADLEALGLPEGDDRWHATALANAADAGSALLRTTLLPGLLAVAARNAGRGTRDLGVFEVGRVFRPGPDPLPPAPRLGTEERPSDDELAALEAALPAQPWRVGVVLTGARAQAGWHGPAAPVTWADAVQAAREAAAAVGVALVAVADPHAPWHPGRSAALRAGGEDGPLVGHAGELHPAVVERLGLPAPAVAAEVDLDLLLAAAPTASVRAPRVSPYPPVGRDVALVAPAEVPAARVTASLAAGAGPLLEALRLFDVYDGPGLPEGTRGLAYHLVLRAGDRTLTDEEANAARDAAVARAGEETGAALRT